MKQKIFTLLLAIGVLTAFQAYADRRVRIRADWSGLERSGVKVNIGGEKDTTLMRGDSFPLIKKDSLYSWLSVDDKGKVVLKRAEIKKADDTLRTNLNRQFYRDNNVFYAGFQKNDSVNYKFYSGETTLELDLEGEGKKTYFEIVGYDKEWKKPLGKREPADLLSFDKVTGRGGNAPRGGGYLASVPATKQEDKIMLDSITYAFVVAHKTTGELALKNFKDFAIYGDSLPSAPYWKYDYRDDKPSLADGRLYWNDSFPHFQILDKNGLILVDTAKDKRNANIFKNWADSILNSKYSKVYTWLDLKLVEGDTVKIELADTTLHIPLDSITHKHPWDTMDELRQPEAQKDKLSPNKLSPLKYKGDLRDTAFHVYLKKDGDRLSFTAKIDSTSNDGGDESEWTNGYPSQFKCKRDKGDSVRYYSIDTSFFTLLDKQIKKNKRDTDTTRARHPRYLYVNDDDTWRPLYVRIDTVPEYPLAEYVGTKWVRENRYALGAALQTIFGTSSVTSTGEHAAIVGKGSADEAKFLFEFVDTIKNKNKNKWFTVNPYKESYKNNSKTFATDPDSIELFRIQYEGKYLTVLDETDFPEKDDAGTVANTQLGWKDKANTAEQVRQYFAVIRNYVDGSVAFLPVASRKWKLEDGKAKYGTTEKDTLDFNLQIGRMVDVGIADLAGTWFISYLSKAGVDAQQYLVIADSSSTQPRIWFNLEPSLAEWKRGDDASDHVAIKQVREEKYYTAKDLLALTNVTENDVTAHWKLEEVVGAEHTWKFTHVVKDAPKDDKAFPWTRWKKDTVRAFTDITTDNIIVAERGEDKVLDTVKVSDIDVSKFSLFSGYAGKDFSKITILSSTENRGISVGTKIEDDVYEASFVVADEYPSVSVERDNGERYLDSDDENGRKYKVFYHQFSRTDDAGDKYVLGVKDNKVSWTLESKLPENKDDYWFAIPKVKDKEDAYYLQSLSNQLVRFKGDGSGLEYAEGESCYGVVALYAGDDPRILSWKFEEVDPLKNSEWVSIDESLFEDGVANGVLTVNYSGVAGSTFVGSKDNKGVLSGDKNDEGIKLQLKKWSADDSDPSSPSAITSSQSGATTVSKERTYYHILQDDLYFTEKKENDATAFEEASEKEDRFSFMKTGEADEILFAIVTDDDRFLSSKGEILAFTDDAEAKLSFQWGKLGEYSAIKAIAAQGNITGTAGGVKVAGITGAVAIYTTDGRLVTKQTVTSPNQTIAVPAGIYVVKSGAEVTKVVVK